jgi:hypothetical protein
MPRRPIPSAPDEYELRKRHIEILQSDPETAQERILEINRRWDQQDHERSKYAQFKHNRENGHGQSSHPKFNEWVAECETDWNDPAKPIPPDFTEWLQLDKNLPRIRGENPPQSYLEESARLDAKGHQATTFLVAGGILWLLLLVAALMAGEILLSSMLFIGGGIACWKLYFYGREQQTIVEQKALPLTLHLYNREYTAPLADNSVIRTNIFFTLPTALAHKDQQLDTFTEKEFLIFVARKLTPPTAEEIQNHLSKKLLPFQDENQIPVLRVEVSLHIHIPSPKPKGGGTVSV